MSEMPAPHDHPEGRRLDTAVWTVVLVALAAVILRRWQDGALVLYVHPGFVPYVAVTAVALIGLAAAQLWKLRTAHLSSAGTPARPISWGIALLVLAVLVAGLVPARPLGSALADAQDASVLPPALLPLTDETAGWTLLEWAQALGGGVRRERLIGRQVSVVGFVHRPNQGSVSGEFLVTRFVVRCCAADGMAVSLRVRAPDADTLAADSWVQVEGVVRLTGGSGDPTVFVEADRLTVVPAPTTPYLSPV